MYVYKNNSEDQADFSQIKYCTKANVPFLAQSGGVGWAKTFDLGSTGVLINLAGLNAVTIATTRKQPQSAAVQASATQSQLRMPLAPSF